MGNIDALLTLHSHLVKSGRADYAQVLPPKYARLAAVDVFDRFLSVRMESKGMLASGFGAYGFELGVAVGVDFGDLVLPGLLTVELSLGAAVKGQSYALLLIHRSMPQSLPAGAPAAGGGAGGPLAGGHRAAAPWQSNRPTCFMTLFGRSFQVQLSAGQKLYLAQEQVELPEEGLAGKALSMTELPLSLGAGAAAEQSYTYQAMKVYDGAPGWYATGQDPNLKQDFTRIVQTIAKTDLKIAILTWLSNFENVYDWSAAVKRIEKTTPEASITVKHVWDDYLTYQFSHHDRVKRSQRIKDQLKSAYLAVDGVSPVSTDLVRKKLVGYWDAAMANTTASADLQKSLVTIVSIVPPDAYIDKFAPRLNPPAAVGLPDKIKQETGLIRDQAMDFSARLATAADQQAQGWPPGAVPGKTGASARASTTPWWYLAFLKASSHAVDAAASAKVNVLAAGLAGQVSGRLKRTAYRYQTYALSDKTNSTLVYTQDTAIVYRQAGMEASAAANLVVFQPKKKIVKPINSSKFVVNGLTYRSIGVYWLYPQRAYQETAPTQMGSGLSYGVSISTADLQTMLESIGQIQAAAKQPAPQGRELKLSPFNVRLLDTLANYLRIPRKTLGEFLAAIPAAKQTEWENLESLLIEASYSFKPLFWPTAWKMKGDQPVCELRGLWENDPYPYCIGFDALRLRGRMVDHRESTHSFRLEAKYVADFGITLSEIKEAGTQSILDLHTQFFNGKDYETAVPPVALFHQ